MDKHQEAEVLAAIARGDFGKPDQFKINTALDQMLRKGRKLDDVSIEFSPKPAIELPAKNAVSSMQVFDSIQQALNPLPDESKKHILSKIDKQIKRSISNSKLEEYKRLSGIDPEHQSALIKQLEPLDPVSRYSTLIKYRADVERDIERVRLQELAMENCQHWLERLQASEAFSLERNDVSRLHKYTDAGENGRVLYIDKDRKPESYWKPHQTFVVKHDWAGAFQGATGVSESIALPYDFCAFEFRVCGNTIIVFAFTADVSDITPEGIVLNAAVECLDHWIMVSERGEKDPSQLLAFLWKQIQAICIALDAEVAVSEVIRASSALNAKREKAGKVPLRDYHVVDLSRRHRIANPAHGESGKKHRMHFVRGHWRHYEESRTWIKWHLRGDPHLGFIQKHYAL